MTITILSSIQNNLDYYNNRAYLECALQKGVVQFLDPPYICTFEKVFINKTRLYDFTRSAKATIRDEMVTHLIYALPGVSIAGDIQMIRAALNSCFFNYQEYKEYFYQGSPQLFESMEMLVFNAVQQYVALVRVACTSCLTGPAEYTVFATLTCQRFTYFPVQPTNVEAVLQALKQMYLKPILYVVCPDKSQLK